MTPPRATLAANQSLQSLKMESILYAVLPNGIVVIRVQGRGNHQTSLALRRAAELSAEPDSCPHYIFDLEKCTSMDSTFLGVLASIALRQQRAAGDMPIVVNVTPHVHEQLDLLGLKYVLHIREGHPQEVAEAAKASGEFAAVETPDISKVDRIAMMIEAHEQLIDIEGDNEIKFRGVLQTLRDSLEKPVDDE